MRARKSHSTQAGYDRFQEAIIRDIQTLLLPQLEQDSASTEQALRNRLFDLPGPRTTDRKATPRELHTGKMFEGFQEVSKSLETLGDIEFYMGRFPFRGGRRGRISRERYLQFHAEAYIHEMYVLDQRLLRYLRHIERHHRGPARVTAERRCEKVRDFVLESLRGMVKIRGIHVHEARFSYPIIDRLGTIGLLARNSDNSLFGRHMRKLYRIESKKIQKDSLKWIRKNNRAVRKLLDAYFVMVFSLVFHDDGTMRYSGA
jgi:hypothetical protein